MSMSTRAQELGRNVAVEQYLNTDGVLYLWDKIKAYVDENSSGDDTTAAPFRMYSMTTGVDITTGNTINVPVISYVGDTTGIAVGDTAVGIIKQGVADKLIFGKVSLINGGNTTVTKDLMQEIPNNTTIDARVLLQLSTFFSDYGNSFWAAFNNESAITVGSKHQLFKTNFITPPAVGQYVTGIITINGNTHMYVIRGVTEKDTENPEKYIQVSLTNIQQINTSGALVANISVPVWTSAQTNITITNTSFVDGGNNISAGQSVVGVLTADAAGINIIIGTVTSTNNNTSDITIIKAVPVLSAESVASQITTALTPYSTTDEVESLINSAVASVYRFAGSVATYANLPTTGMANGDVFNVEDTDMNYAWVQPETGDGYWDPLGTTFNIEPIPNSVIQQIVEGTYGS